MWCLLCGWRCVLNLIGLWSLFFTFNGNIVFKFSLPGRIRSGFPYVVVTTQATVNGPVCRIIGDA